MMKEFFRGSLKVAVVLGAGFAFTVFYSYLIVLGG